MPMGSRGMMGVMQMTRHSEGRVAFLKAEPAITNAQKTVWDAYAAAIKANLQSMQDMMQTMRAVFEAKTLERS
jgi:hypothetical protein